jgi:hypothetical protein
MKKIIIFFILGIILFSGCLGNGSEKGTTINESLFSQPNLTNSTNQTIENKSIFFPFENRTESVPRLDYEIVSECIELCKHKLNSSEDLSSGPCISDSEPEWPINSYVCDVVYYPRNISVDNKMENQCKD